jgi:thioredoxin-like negative regulator of GroEL
MRLLRVALAVTGLALCACACSQGPPGTGAPAVSAGENGHASAPAGVAWFEGEVAQAFIAAQQQHKPVFVYFGAVWCPPCQELKATIFRRKDFLDRLTLFIPVYLDGDAPGAQRWADEFHIAGYPTVLVLRSDRRELERVSGGMDLGRYAEVLDLGTSAARPAAEVLSSIEQGAGTLSRDECRLLAYNAWYLTDEWIFSEEHAGWLARTATALGHAAERCVPQATTERARLRVVAAEAAVAAESESLKAGKAPSPALADAVERVRAILGDAALSASVADALEGLPAPFFTALRTLDPARAPELERASIRVMEALAADERYSAADRLYAIGAEIKAAKALEPAGKPPAALAQEARRRVERALAAEHEPYARTSLVNSALNVLGELDDRDRSYAILAAEIETSKTPYYYMSDLGEVEEERGHKAEALAWFARAYRESEGPATRAQWGMIYLRALLRIRPEDEAGIRDAALQVLGELDGGERIHGRTRAGLGRLALRLHEWSKDGSHAAAITAIRARMDGICRKLPAGDAGIATCSRFLASV